MEYRDMNQTELTTLINAVLNETASDAERQQLENLLRGNAGAIQQYLEFCEMHIDLSIDTVADGAMERFCGQQAQVTAIAAASQNARPVAFSGNSSKSIRMSGVALWGLLACGLAFVLGGFWWTVRIDSIAQVQVDQVQADNGPNVPSSSFAPTSITLPSGSSTRMHFDKVGYATIHGPANFQLINPMRARLRSGPHSHARY